MVDQHGISRENSDQIEIIVLALGKIGDFHWLPLRTVSTLSKQVEIPAKPRPDRR